MNRRTMKRLGKAYINEPGPRIKPRTLDMWPQALVMTAVARKQFEQRDFTKTITEVMKNAITYGVGYLTPVVK